MRPRWRCRFVVGRTQLFVASMLVPLIAQLAGGATFWVTTTADSGPGSLREQIMTANTTAGPDTIGFAIPGPGTHTIALTGALPPIRDTLCLDGYNPAWRSASD